MTPEIDKILQKHGIEKPTNRHNTTYKEIYDSLVDAMDEYATSLYQHLQENGRVAELEKEVEVIAMQRDYFIKDQAAKHNEIERLKGLAMKMFADGLKAFMPMTDLEIDKCIEQFKTENNL